MMRKLFTILLVSLLLVTLVACDISDTEPSDSSNIPSQSETQNNETENKETDSSETEEPTVEKTKHSNLCKNRHSSPICTQFEHHPAGVLAPLSRSEAPMPYNWFSTAIL